MTTRIKITNIGPDQAKVTYYDADRRFKKQQDVLSVGASIEIDVWDGHVPVLQATPHAIHPTTSGPAKLFTVPPATIAG